MTALLSQPEIDSALKTDVAQWQQDGDALVRSVTATSFLEGIDLVRRVADAAEEMNHHPDIDIRWTTITFHLSTHSAGGITASDLALARKIDATVRG
jgi:4a-hydroxytetrahydrobiopterin dehydratase